ncbi:hypothetical protein ACWEWD_11815 [Streptomyces tendae]
MDELDPVNGDGIEPVSAMIGVAVLLAACWPLKSRAYRLRLLLAITLIALAGIGFQYVEYEDAGFWQRHQAERDLIQMLAMAGPGGAVALVRLLGSAFSTR